MTVKSRKRSLALTKAQYHHGDLRRSLINAALDVLVEADPASLSLVQLSRNAKVSSGAPYHHFRDRSELLANIAAEGFEHLGTALRKSAEAAPSPLTVPERFARTYIAFARAHPAYYKVMFRPEVTSQENIGLLRAPAEACFELLVDALKGLDLRGSKRSRVQTAVAIWSLVHGLIELYDHGPLEMKLAEKDLERIAETSVSALLSG